MSRNETTTSALSHDDKLLWSWSSLSKDELIMDKVQPDMDSCDMVAKQLPKFKMNEPGPVAMMNSIFQQNNIVNDETEESFIILGKASFESVRETSLASYAQLKQKGLTPDHLSLISMMSPSQMEENLKKVLDENIQLKETLKQNNDAIKKQFETIKTWQNEVMSTCDSHKQRFLEAKEFMSCLKRENDALREKMNNQLSGIVSSDTAVFPKNNHVQSCQESNNAKEHSSSVGNDLDKEIHSLNGRVETISISPRSCNSDVQEQNDELKIPGRKIDESDNSNSKIQGMLKCACKSNEIEYLKGIITTLEQQLVSFEENKFSENDVCLETSVKIPQDKNFSTRNVLLYKEIVDELRKSFTSQCARYLHIQDLLKESADILLMFKNANIAPDVAITNHSLQEHVEKLNSHRKKIVNEQLQLISDKQSVLKALKEFQRIYSDFNTLSCELEILKDENLKLLVMQTQVSEGTLENLVQLEKNLEREKEELQNKESTLLEDRLTMQMEKKLVMDEKGKIEIDRRSLTLEADNLGRTKRHLIEEREALDHQSRLYEIEKENLQQEKKSLQMKCESLIDQMNSLRKDLDEANATIQQLRAQNHKLSDNEEIISVYRIQTEMHVKEFEEMKTAHKSLQDQLQALATINLQLQTENERLGGNSSLHSSSTESRYCSICSKYIVPGDRHGLDVCENLREFD